MIIKRKVDVKYFLVHFCDYALWDGSKYYLVIEDASGTITFMQYPYGECTYHRKNKTFSDLREQKLDVKVIWMHRKMINKYLKKQRQYIYVDHMTT
jgi:hypothetical protein